MRLSYSICLIKQAKIFVIETKKYVFNKAFKRKSLLNFGSCPKHITQEHFPNNHKYKIFNTNNVKISYSCMENIKSIINMHNKEV